jgi:hypothetical protein
MGHISLWLILMMCVNILEDSIDTIKKNMEILIEASKDVGLEINVEISTCCCLITRLHVKIVM